MCPKNRHFFTEIPYEDISFFSEEDRLYHNSSPGYNQIHDKMVMHLREAFDILTPHQYKVITLYLDGYSQVQIASFLNVTQPAIYKCIHGNWNYTPEKKHFGGIIKKIRKHLESKGIVEDVNKLLKEMRSEI